MKVSFHPEVKADLRGCYKYYRGIDPELARGFIECGCGRSDSIGDREGARIRISIRLARSWRLGLFVSMSALGFCVGGRMTYRKPST